MKKITIYFNDLKTVFFDFDTEESVILFITEAKYRGVWARYPEYSLFILPNAITDIKVEDEEE